MQVKDPLVHPGEATALTLDILTRAFDDLPMGVGIFHVPDLADIESIRYVYMNKVVLYEMRKTKEEVIGKRIIEVAPEAYEHEGGKIVIETYRRIAEKGGVANLGLVEYSNHLVAGTYECSVHHIMKHYVYVVLRNVTELEQTKNELQERNKELSQYAHIASHDLKEPLNTISGFLSLLEEEYADKLDEEAQNLMGYINQTTGRMRRLIDTLLEYSTMGQGETLSWVDCEEMLENIKQDLSVKIEASRAKIEVNNMPKLQGYATELRLLFQNLICNSIKYTAAGVIPHVVISATKENGAWLFSVQDNGIGIAKKDQTKIFSIFERIRAKKHTEGVGIGLAHCKKIVELHQGKLWVDSEPDCGSTFYFTISNAL